MIDPVILSATSEFDAARASDDEVGMDRAIHRLDPLIAAADPEAVADAAVMYSNLPYKRRQDLHALDGLLGTLFDHGTQAKVDLQPYKARFWYVVSALCLKLNEFDRAIHAGELATIASEVCSDTYIQARIKVALSHEMSAFDKPGKEAEAELALAKNVYSSLLDQCKRASGLYMGNLGEILHGLAHVINEQSVWNARWKGRDIPAVVPAIPDGHATPVSKQVAEQSVPLLEDGLARFVEADSQGIFGEQGPPTGLSGVQFARLLMERAVTVQGEGDSGSAGIKFVVCQGTLLAEARDYAQARDHYAKILDPSNLVKTQPEDLDEAHFYLADALTWLGAREAAKEHFDTFRDGCVKRNDYDGLAHYRIFTIADRLRTSDLQRLSDKDLVTWIGQLEEYTPSRFAMPSIREYHRRLKSVLMFIQEIHQHVISPTETYRWTATDLIRWSNSCCMRPPVLPVLTDLAEPVKVSPKTLSTMVIHPPLTPDEIQSLPGVYLGLWTDTPPVSHSILAGALSPTHRCVTANRHIAQCAAGPNSLAGFLVTDSPEQATVLASIGAILWRVHRELVEPFYPFVLAPVERAPVFEKQGGDVGYVHSGNSSKS